MEKKHYLMDVVLMRLVLITVLILYHAMCIHTGAWKPPIEGFQQIVVYDWIGMLPINFFLEAMVLISGSLLGYKLLLKPESLTFNICVVKKAKRLLLPCFLFSILYYIMFLDTNISLFCIVLHIVNGCGHLWFLPMIFWCFVITYLIAKFIPSRSELQSLLLVIFALMAIYNPLSSLPAGLGSVGNFLFYFYAGYLLKLGHLKLPIANSRNIIIATSTFFVMFLVYMIIRQEIHPTDIISKAAKMLSMNIAHMMMCITAIFTIYTTANKPCVIRYLTDRPQLITISGYCYGVYIYQQFILKLLYYRTPMLMLVNKWLLPWIAFVIALVVSLLLCHLTLRTRWGRYLIG
ncbi:acyltransferase [uncultured Phocaeicola sp.]|uniref:acyltransferase family protein n=1 Tax=uncultured Phocaeicola sp. TaxID=990718 RepID=UPI0025D014AB|nr:acyltransferase [uncultured Phocaeicola sp.]